MEPLNITYINRESPTARQQKRPCHPSSVPLKFYALLATFVQKRSYLRTASEAGHVIFIYCDLFR